MRFRNLTYMHNIPSTPNVAAPQERGRNLKFLEFLRDSVCFFPFLLNWGWRGIYTRNGGASVMSLGNVGLGKFRFSKPKT